MPKKTEPVFGELNKTTTPKDNGLEWRVSFDGAGNIVLFIENGWGMISHSTVRPDDAEAIAYCLLYAAKVVRGEA